jgi:hypothetical protein
MKPLLRPMILILALAQLSSTVDAQALAEHELTNAQALQIWDSTKDREQYQSYGYAFVQWNNRLQLDTKNSCYSKGDEQVTLLIVISGKGEIGPVFTSVEGEKAECFRLTYQGFKFDAPPFSPLVLELVMK